MTKKVARKAVTKTRNAISKGKSRTISKRIGKIATSALFNMSVSAANRQTHTQTFKTTGFGAMQGAMSLGYDTLKVFAGTSGFQVGSCIIGGVDYPNDFAFGLLDAGTM